MAETKTTRWDSWKSFVMGFGDTMRDKITTMLPTIVGDRLDYKVLAQLLEKDDVVKKMMSKHVDEIFNVGYEVETDDPELDKSIKDFIATSDLNSMVANCMIRARMLGGCALYVVVDDGLQQWETLNINGVRSLIGFQVLTPEEIQGYQYNRDPASIDFGKPINYRTNGQSTAVIHASRLVIFDGLWVTNRRREELQGWGASVYALCERALQTYHTGFNGAGALGSDLSQGVYSIRNLIEGMAGGQEDVILHRMRINDMTRSSMRSLVIDAEGEKFERVPSQLSGVPELVGVFEKRLASAAEMPLTVLFGTSPAGMNATGESDLANWYKACGAMREKTLKPALERIFQIVMLAPNGPTYGEEPEKWDIEFPPFSEPSEKEIADTRKVYADIDAAYINAGVVMPQEVALSRFGAGGWDYGMTIESTLRQEPAGNAAAIESTNPAPASGDQGNIPATPNSQEGP